MDFLAVATGIAGEAARLAPGAEAEPLFQINLFQVIIAATNFVVFLAIIWTFAFKPVQRMLAERKERIEEGLRDAEQARKDRESAEAERLAAIQEARREANDILARAQKVADESRERDLAATREELERLRDAGGRGHRVREAACDRRAAGRGRGPRAPGGEPGGRRNDDRRPAAASRRAVPRRGRHRQRESRRLMAIRDSSPRRYADAAFEIATRDGTIETWRRDLDGAAAELEGTELMAVLANPALSLEQRTDVARKVFDGLSAPARNLILLLVRRGRIEQLPRVAAEFRRLDDRRQGITNATATSAMPLTDTEVRALTARLEQMTGGRIALQTDVDEGLIGGLVVRVGDRLIDGSVRGRLERLRNQLASGAL